MAGLGLPWERASHVVLTHFHTDHFADLPHLLFALKWGLASRRSRPLRVVGPEGICRRAELLAEAYGPHMLDPGFELTYEAAIPEEPWVCADSGLTLDFAPAGHAPGALAVRASLDSPEAASVGYTGDAQGDLLSGAFFSGVDALVSECSFEHRSRKARRHLAVPDVARLALEAKPGTLVLTHVKPPLLPETAAELVKEAGYNGRTLPGRDGLAISLG